MSAAPLPDPAADPRTARHLRMLERLSEIAMALAEEIGREALSGEPGRSPAELGLVFARVARAVRQGIALEARLVSGAELREIRVQEAQVRAELERAREDAGLARASRKAELREIVGMVLEVETDACARDLVLTDFEARLERADTEGELFTRPLGEALSAICRQLRLTPDWGLWEADWAREAEAAEAWRDPFDDPEGCDPGGAALFAALDEITARRAAAGPKPGSTPKPAPGPPPNPTGRPAPPEPPA